MLDALERWLRLSAERLHDQAATLTALDQAIGDGDHGINMDRGFTAIVALLDAGPPEADDDRARAGDAPANRRPDPDQHGRWRVRPAVRHGLHAGRRRHRRRRPGPRPAQLVWRPSRPRSAGIQSLGKATTGEKTMLDALIPALEAGRAALRRRRRPQGRTPAMADAAEAGAAPRSRCSRRRVARRISASAASATRTRARRRRRCSCAPSPTSSRPAERTPEHASMTRSVVLTDASARPVSGVGRLLVVAAEPTARRRCRGARGGRATPRRARRSGGARDRGRRARGAGAARSPPRAGEEIGAIFEAQALFARDPASSSRRCARWTTGRPPTSRSSPARTTRRASSPRSMTSTSAPARPTSATSAGGSPASCAATPGRTCGMPMAGRRHRGRRPRPVRCRDAPARARRPASPCRRRADRPRVDRRRGARDPAGPGPRPGAIDAPRRRRGLVDGRTPAGRLIIEPDEADLADARAAPIARPSTGAGRPPTGPAMSR